MSLWCVTCDQGSSSGDFLDVCFSLSELVSSITEIHYISKSIPYVVFPLDSKDGYEKIRKIEKFSGVTGVFPHKGRQDLSL